MIELQGDRETTLQALEVVRRAGKMLALAGETVTTAGKLHANAGNIAAAQWCIKAQEALAEVAGCLMESVAETEVKP